MPETRTSPTHLATLREHPEPTARPPGKARLAALGVLCVTVLIANLDSTVLNVALPTLVRDLNASSSDLQWIVDAYIIVFAGLLLTAGSLADRIGRKKTFLAGLAVFASGSAWAAFSGSASLLIAARASMGIGGALMIPSTLSIIRQMFPDPAERQRAISLWAGTSGLGVALGPIIGGVLLAHFWWGSVFLVNVPIAAAGLVAAIWLVPDSRNPVAHAPDLAGAFLSIAGIVLILWSIIEGPVRGWSDPMVIASGSAGLALVAIFAYWEHLSSHPMLHLSFFRQRSFAAAIPAVATVTFGLTGALFVLTQFLQFSLGFSPLQAGIRILPAAGAVMLAAPLSAVGVRVAGPKLTMAAGLALIAAGLWLVSGVTPSTTFGGIVLGMVLCGAGSGLALPTASGAVMGSVPSSDSGVASATNTTANQLGGALGVAVVGSFLSSRATGATGQSLAHLARTAFTSGLDRGMLAAAAVALAGCLITLAWLPASRPGRARPGWQRRSSTCRC
jgi:EmrB/QacA subfamily drug resistance transporter